MHITHCLKTIIAWSIILFLGGCVRIPAGVEPVTGFDVNRYLGTWYEIARLDHPFERGLTHVTAQYSLREDGAIQVINRGYDPAGNTWKEVQGKAYFVNSPQVGKLKVSFFGPFYGGYNVIALDQKNYAHALVCGPSFSYLWILARTPDLDGPTLQRLVTEAKSLGFNTDTLIYVQHDKQEESPL